MLCYQPCDCLCLHGRDGIVKMQGVYQTNPQLGDANSVQHQLDESNQKLAALESELAKFEVRSTYIST